ncbi:hypothetical protein C8J57DRAFT_311201 [Mycena rebaudengoi]|nr:hypothetical protein C8J57DRAFT_311201 [Mycena rebaudengoi]
MRFPTSLLAVLVCIYSTACTALTNYTIDDTNPSVQYNPPNITRCTLSTCIWVDGLHNHTSTITAGAILLSFTGHALYVFLDVIGSCTFTLDGTRVGRFENNRTDWQSHLAYSNTSILDGPHLLLISPAQPNNWIGFDYIEYTTGSNAPAGSNAPSRSRKPRVGAIIGGVLGGVAFIAAMGVAAFFLRRRSKRQDIFVKGVPLGEDDDRSTIGMVQMAPQSKR